MADNSSHQKHEAPEARSSEGIADCPGHTNNSAQAGAVQGAQASPLPTEQFARWFASIGLHPHLVHGIQRDGSCTCGRHPAGNKQTGKHPVASGWQTRELDIEQLCSALRVNPELNLGLRTGAQPGGDGLVVLDVDDPAQAADVARELGDLPPTLTVVSQPGQGHLYYSVPLDVLPKLGNWTKRNGIDLRTEGGQVVAPPSRHYKGGWYQFQDNGATRPVQLPQRWLDWLVSQSSPRVERDAVATDCPPELVRDDRWLDDARAHIRNMPAARKGDGGTPLMAAAGVAMRGYLLTREAADRLLREEWCPRCVPPWRFEAAGDEHNWQHTLDRAETMSTVAWGSCRPKRGIGYECYDHPAEVPNPAASTAANDTVSSGAQPTVDLSGLQLHPQTGLPWIVRDKQACWIHAVDGEGYGPAVAKCDVRLEVMRTLGRLVQVEHEGKALGDQTFDKLYVQRAAEVVQTYVARTSAFDKATRRLTLAALRWTKREAQHHADVEAWLKALAVNDEQFERLNQWLAGLLALDRPAPILHIHGPAGIGKDLLAHGIASLWSGAPSLIDESLSDFNEASASMPVIWSDEQLPAGTDFGWLRHAATARTRRVNMKYLSKVDVEGCARLIMTSNDPDILRFVRTGVLKRVDLDAVRERLLVIDARASEARSILSQLDTSAIARGKLAEHCLWLASTVPLEPMTSRMCARPYGGEVSLEVHAGQRNAKVLRAIAARLPPELGADDTEDSGVADVAPAVFHPPQPQTEGRPAEGVWLKPSTRSDEPPALLVNVRLLAACTADVAGRNPITEQDIRDCCDVYAAGAESLDLRLPGSGRRASPLSWRVLELARVRSAVRTLD